MAKGLEHEEIAARFLDSGAINFDAVGKFVTELGPELVARDTGLHGVLFGKFSTIACALTADDLRTFLGGQRGAGLAEAIDLPVEG